MLKLTFRYHNTGIQSKALYLPSALLYCWLVSLLGSPSYRTCNNYSTGLLYGEVDEAGNLSGKDIAYIYPGKIIMKL